MFLNYVIKNDMQCDDRYQHEVTIEAPTLEEIENLCQQILNRVEKNYPSVINSWWSYLEND